ncbi:hypothetical protein ACFLVS_00620 [Chloroflexota bacterium]
MMPLDEAAVQITIVDDSRREKCDFRYGIDWSSDEVIVQASDRVKDRFGSKIKLDYLDLAKPATNRYALELSRRARKEALPLPLLVVNGQPRISGEFDIRLLLDAVETELEIKP